MPRSIPIILDRPRNLRFDINAIGDADFYLRATLLEILQQAVSGVGMRVSDIRTLLWAGLKHEDPHLSQAAAGNLIQVAIDGGTPMHELQAKIADALVESGLFSRAGQDGKNDSPEAVTQPTSGSGSSSQEKTPMAH